MRDRDNVIDLGEAIRRRQDIAMRDLHRGVRPMPRRTLAKVMGVDPTPPKEAA